MDFLPSNLALFLAAAIALVVTPGPAVLYIITRSVEQGRRAGLASVMGVELGNLFHVIGAAFGISAILLSSALAFEIVKYLGAAYLIYLGIRKLMSRDEGEQAQVIEHKSLRRVFSQAVIVATLNPKTALFFFAFLPQFVDANRGSVTLQMLILGLIIVTIAVISDSLYALAAGTAGKWLRGSLRYLRFQRYFTGTIYIGLGISAALASGNRK
ncbi:MAG TPA: LysE family translocator [Oceanobacillus sp.]|nr:LysE family translocator [Oceanobacillus sp.]